MKISATYLDNSAARNLYYRIMDLSVDWISGDHNNSHKVTTLTFQSNGNEIQYDIFVALKSNGLSDVYAVNKANKNTKLLIKNTSVDYASKIATGKM